MIASPPVSFSAAIEADAREAAYRAFVHDKIVLARAGARHIEAGEINPFLKPHQVDCVRWAVRGGKRALFAAFGLGKSFMQIEWLRLMTPPGGMGLIVAPLGVRRDMMLDAQSLATGEHPAATPEQTQAIRAFIAADPSRAPVLRFVKSDAEIDGPGLYLTNYESVREGKVTPARFAAASLDEAAILRGMGGVKTFREFMSAFESVPAKLVATATPSPNDYIELLAYAAYLDVMEVGEAKTRFFKRDSTKADNLTLHPHKEREFWLWVASWALFVQRPSDLGHSDEGYDLPPINVRWHEVESPLAPVPADGGGQGALFDLSSTGLSQAAAEKRRSLPARVAKVRELLAARPDDHCVVWHDLEDERRALEAAIPAGRSVYGAMPLDDREAIISDFADGRLATILAKPVMLGSGCNLQRHCGWEIFAGVGFKFNDFIQAIHRVHRFLQPRPVTIDIIHSRAEWQVVKVLKEKWAKDTELRARMTGIIKEFGLSEEAMRAALTRSEGVTRVEVTGEDFRLIHNDCVLEMQRQPENSVDLVVSSIPFSTQYEYTPSLNDFGHTDDNAHFFAQMDFLTPELLRALKPGRIAAIHVKDRVTPGGVNGLGYQTVQPFHAETITHFCKHGFGFMGQITIATDVVRENNQTYRLSYSEMVKDGSKMSCGMSEYVLLFRKNPTSRDKAYADEAVRHDKKWFEDEGDTGARAWSNLDGYSLARWQIDAHGLWRSSGDRFIRPDDLTGLPADMIYKRWKAWSLAEVYDYEHHVAIAEGLSIKSRLPTTFMLVPAHVTGRPDVWTDVARMRTLNMVQQQKGMQQHLCPLQFDIVKRLIERFSMPGETVLDPFGGLMTVPYMALKMGRKGVGIELNPGYFADGVRHVEALARGRAMPSLFDLAGMEAAPDPADDEDAGLPPELRGEDVSHAIAAE